MSRTRSRLRLADLYQAWDRHSAVLSDVTRELATLTSKIAQQNEALQRLHFEMIKLKEDRDNHISWYDRLRLRLARRQA